MMDFLVDLEMRILAELDEAGFEELQTLIVTCLDQPIEGVPQEIRNMRSALISLCQKGHILIQMPPKKPGISAGPLDHEASVKVLNALEEVFTFGSVHRDPLPPLTTWHSTLRDPDGSIAHYPVAAITDSGVARAAAIMNERPYQWWVPK